MTRYVLAILAFRRVVTLRALRFAIGTFLHCGFLNPPIGEILPVARATAEPGRRNIFLEDSFSGAADRAVVSVPFLSLARSPFLQNFGRVTTAIRLA